MRLRRRALHLAVLLSVGWALAGGPPAARAAPSAAPAVGLVVNVLTDAPESNLSDPACQTATPNQCSLRAALQQANANAGPDTITFSVTGTITLTSPSPTITDTLTLLGPGADLLTVDADGTGSVLKMIGAPAGGFWVEGLTLTGGGASQGAGLVVAGQGTAVISATVLTGNVAGSGGGAFLNGDVQLINSAVITNGAGTHGGGLLNSGKLVITNSRIEGNWVAPLVIADAVEPQGFVLTPAGGGIYADGPLTMTDSLVANNYVVGPFACPLSGDICPLTLSPAGSGPYGAGLTLVQTHAEIQRSTLSGNYFTGSVAGQASPAGSVQGVGGGLYTYAGVVVLRDTQVIDNEGYLGGGLFNDGGDMTLRRVTLFDNTAQTAGGGVFSSSGPLLVEDSTFVENRAILSVAGGLYFTSGQLTVRGSEFDHNTAGLGGGGLSIFDTLGLVEGTQVHGNIAGYAPFAGGQALTPQGTTADGGGLLLGASIIVIRQSAVYSNTTNNGSGGGLSNSGTLTMTNVTVSGNTATDNGGGLALTLVPASVASETGIGPAIRAALSYVTIANNTTDYDNDGSGNGGGVSAVANVTVTFNSTLVALNADLGGQAPACGGPGGFVSAGYNLWTVTTNCGITPTTGDQFNVAAGLQPLQNNGGGTWTHGLAFGSLALDTADPATCPPADQRGIPRPFGTGCDIGAFELGAVYLPIALR